MKNDMVNKKMREQLVREVASYYVDTQSTIRKTAEFFYRSKTWVHRILQVEINNFCPDMKEDVKNAIKANKDARYYRGGQAAKKRKEKIKSGGTENVDTKKGKIR